MNRRFDRWRGCTRQSAVWSSSALVVLTLCGGGAAAGAGVAPGDPDHSFNGTGARIYQPRGMPGSVRDVVIQHDGKILVAGYTGDYYTADRDAIVMRLNPDGSPDQGFGLGGVVALDFNVLPGLTSTDYANALALDSRGRIIVAGLSSPDNGGTADGRATIARLLPNGALDTSFSGDGKLVENLGYGCGGGSAYPAGDGMTDIVTLPDGRLRLAGYADQGSGNGDVVVLGLTADGSRDCGFGNGGRAFVDFGREDSAAAMALAPGGDLVVAGASFDEYGVRPALARLTATGVLVTGFGAGGRWVVPPDITQGSIKDVLVQPDGRMVLAIDQQPGTGHHRAGLIRVNQDGSVDPLGSTGMLMPAIEGGNDYVGTVVRDARGRLLLSALSSGADAQQSIRVARFAANGRTDATFGRAGIVRIPVGTSGIGRGYGAPTLAVQADGRIVMAGTAAFRFDVRRFLSDPPRGRATISFPRTKILIKARRGTWTARCHNVTGDECRLTLTLKTRKSRPKVVGAITGTIAGGRNGLLTVRLNKAGRRLLARHHKLKVRAVGTSRNGAGTATAIKQPLTLKAKNPKRKHG